ncbi:hypothetical protein ACUXST_000152 [Sphingomonas sp. F9_3S_D5_B_2]
MTAEDWGLPDWTESSAYPPSVSLTKRQWWWQFTRRNPDYRKLWLEACALREPHQTMGTDGRWYGPRMQYAGDAKAIETLRVQFRLPKLLDPACDFSDSILMTLMEPTGGIHHLPRSGAVDRARRRIERGEDINRLRDEYADCEEIRMSAGLVNYEFDLRKPLPAQMKKAEEHLRNVQAATRGRQKWKPEPGNWSSYLRVLDARDAKASWSTIGRTLWPNEVGDLVGRARMHHAGACRVRDRFPL